jgi:hypothetical protein
MRSTRRWKVANSKQCRAAIALLLLASALTVSPAGQIDAPPRWTPGSRGISVFDDAPDPVRGFSERRLRALNAERQKSLVADTQKLLKLARELNTELQNSDGAALTPAQGGKMAEIEKLAHHVKQKMSESVAGVPSTLPALTPSPLDR